MSQIFTSKLKYYAFDKLTSQEKAKRSQDYWQIYMDEEKKLAEAQSDLESKFDLIDYAISTENFVLRINNKIPKNDPREIALRNIQQRHHELEPGQDLYYPDRAKQWLERIEETINQDPNIEDIIQLLALYDIPEVQNLEKKRNFENMLEKLGEKATLEEQKEIGDYFFNQIEHRGEKLFLEKIHKLRDIIEKKIEASHSIKELTEAAEWYHGGEGILGKNFDKAYVIYTKLLSVVSADENYRIKHCLETLKTEKNILINKVFMKKFVIRP